MSYEFHAIHGCDRIIGSLPVRPCPPPALAPHGHELEVPPAVDEHEYEIEDHQGDDDGDENPAKSPDGGRAAVASEHQQEHAHEVKANLVTDVLVTDKVALPLPFVQHVAEHEDTGQHQ